MEYLEEAFPEKPILPKDLLQRAQASFTLKKLDQFGLEIRLRFDFLNRVTILGSTNLPADHMRYSASAKSQCGSKGSAR